MFLVLPAHLKFRPHNFVSSSLHHSPEEVFTVRKLPRNTSALHYRHGNRNPMLCCSKISLYTRACTDGGQAEYFAAQKQSPVPDIQALRDDSSSSHDGYVALFIRMLGLDNDIQDREQAVVALWKYSLGGKQCVDNIMKHHGSVNLIVNLLNSGLDSACEAAAGLLRVISSINLYRDVVAGTSAIEEMTSLLRRSSLFSDVKEHTICTLWNLSVDEKLSARIASSEVLSLIIKYLDDECIKVKEAAGGVLANLTLSQSNHRAMVEAGVIPKLAKLITTDLEESKVIKKSARSALLELAKDNYNRILVLEEGLVVVPLVGSEAYKSFRPALYSWPSLPDGTKIEQKSKVPSKYGASELLIGLNIDKNVDLEKAKMNAVVGRTQQQFLARIGAIEVADENNSDSNWSSSQSLTLLPWTDAVARLVLILGLEDASAVAKAAETIADASINEHMRIAFKEAGAIKNLAGLINHPNDAVRVAAVRALDRLSISNSVCQMIEAEGILHLLVSAIKPSGLEISHNLTPMILNILSRILDPNKEMKSKVSQKGWDITRHPSSANDNEVISSKFVSSMPTVAGGNLFDSTFLSSLVNVMKTTPNLQRKAASVLEFITVIEPCVEKLVSAGIESGLEAVFRQKILTGTKYDTEGERAEAHILELEEAGLAVSAAAQLLTKLLDHGKFREIVNSHHFMKLLYSILVSDIPLENKEWVAACLVKLSTLSDQSLHIENPVHMEVAFYETIPRLIEQMKSTYSEEVRETAVLELNKIISGGVVDYSRAVASGGGIFPLVNLMGNGSDQAVEASLAILYNLSMDTENHPAIIAAGAVPVLRKLVLSQRSQWMRALHLLRTLPT